MRSLREREPAALRRFWERERPVVYRICARVLGEGADARDVADGVLVDFMFDCVKRLDSAGTMGAYVRLMAARRALRRRERLVKQVAVEVDRAADEHQTLRFAGEVSALEHCLRQLTPKAQEAVRLRYSADLTQQQIGEIIGGSKQYIGRLLSQCIETLRSCLEARGFEVGKP